MQSEIQASILPDGVLLLIVTGDYYKDHESFFNGDGLRDTLAAMMDSLKRGLIKDKAVAKFIGTMTMRPNPEVEVELRGADGTVIEVEGHRVS